MVEMQFVASLGSKFYIIQLTATIRPSQAESVPTQRGKICFLETNAF